MRPVKHVVNLSAAVLLLLQLFLPGAAVAQAATSGYQGTYQGVGTVIASDGQEASAPVTVWVEDLGEAARFTLEAEGVVGEAEGPARVSGDNVVVQLSIDQAGVTGSGQVTIELLDDTWVLDATGSGEGLGYSGSGTVAATRTSTGVQVPGLFEQVTDMVSAMFGGPAGSSDDGGPSSGGTGAPDGAAVGDSGETDGESAPPSTVDASEPSPIAPAIPQPPMSAGDALVAAGLAAMLLVMEIMAA